jgi:succinate dehydrogenase / fumarate reductase membrane anchor subunit
MSNDATPSIHIRRSALGRAQGLGSAKDGLHHWWVQRLTALALLPLVIYFVISVLMLSGASRAGMQSYFAEPWNTVLFLALIGALFYHAQLGLQTVIEDYIRPECVRLAAQLVVKGGIALLALACAVSVLKLAFA